MKRKNICMISLIATVFTFASLPANSQSSGDKGAKSYVAAAYKSMDLAAERKDARGALAYNAPSFVSIGPRGEQGGPNQALMTSFLFARSKTIRGTTAIQSFNVTGTSATVRVKKHQEMTVIVPDPDTGLYDKYALDTIRQDHWGKMRNGWIRLSSQELMAHETRNGKPLPHRK